ncbi:hypothetical protein CC80DRAFT_275494 [Byssothecium circinans]|uniref:Uncharacterized protein n=1 Tax=Byssothecium circinans TaxID=147558 RepID=A0A6A5T8I5_9PLEO|nr:hypothetical protein CC80DRAFT_275494 [Byssothecium circinans]
MDSPPPQAPRQPSNSPTPQVQTLILSHPSARLSSSPASSPRLVEPPPTRKKSIRPETSHLMDQYDSPGPDFFEDSSDNNSSEWEDDNETREFSGTTNLLNQEPTFTEAELDDFSRGRQQTSTTSDKMPGVISAHANSAQNLSPKSKGIDQASQMSLRRLGKVRLVHNRGSGSAGRCTPRESLMSNDADNGHPVSDLLEPFPKLPGRGSGAVTRSNADFRGRHRHSTSKSIRTDSILNAHVITMKALEALPSTTSLSQIQRRSRSFSHHLGILPKSKPASFSEDRQVALSPLQTGHADLNRAAHLPPHFIKTPYPFSPRKEFPRPKTRPRQSTYGSDKEELDNKKGKHVLGIVASEGEFDLRSRLERNEEAQGIIRTRSGDGHERGRWDSGKKVDGEKEARLWLTLRKEPRNRVEQMTISSTLRKGSKRSRGKSRKPSGSPAKNGDVVGASIDFDDMIFAERLKAAYNTLAGPWFLRLFSARGLRTIRVAQHAVWSGTTVDNSHRATGRLLAAHGGYDLDPEAQTPFTEYSLMKLYRDPKLGKARYTWVHWAKRVAAWNTSAERLASSDSIVAIQFEQCFSVWRILLALWMMVVLSTISVLIWIFLGTNTWVLSEKRGRAERVETGLILGVFVMLVQLVVFAGWIAVSWMWL